MFLPTVAHRLKASAMGKGFRAAFARGKSIYKLGTS